MFLTPNQILSDLCVGMDRWEGTCLWNEMLPMVPDPWSFKGKGSGIRWHIPSEDQTKKGADKYEDLVEHGRVGPLDGTMEIVLRRKRGRGRVGRRKTVRLLNRLVSQLVCWSASLSAYLSTPVVFKHFQRASHFFC